MPNHLRLLLETDECRKFLALFKQKTGYYFKQKSGLYLWQKSYYDHILRSDEDLRETVAYILNNPVRAKLVPDYLSYPYSGSLEISIKDFVEG